MSKAITIEEGKFYLNGRGDAIGPMDERQPGIFLDQYGRLYHPDGRQWDHVPGSTGNIVNSALSQPAEAKGEAHDAV